MSDRPSVDLNADLGEGDLFDAELLSIVSSCNIACGGHTGDAVSMRATVATAMLNNVAIGAHPAYPDRDGFGRRSGFLRGSMLEQSLSQQIQALADIVAGAGLQLSLVKPHGALYNDAVGDFELASTIAAAIAASACGAAMVGLPNSELQNAAAAASLNFVSEGFIDRAYCDDGTLLPRTQPGAVHDDIATIEAQARSLVGRVDTLCIHGDTPGAADMASGVRQSLEDDGVMIRAISR